MFYKGVKNVLGSSLKKDLNDASGNLYKKIIETDLSGVSISSDMKRNYSGKVNSLKTNLAKYSYHLGLAINSRKKGYNELTIIDHGGGTGLLGLLAKELGIKMVIYNDINKEWTHDAQTIARKFNLESDYYISGDFDELLDFISSKSIFCDAIISYNVIEHIYDIKGFFRRLYQLNIEGLSIVMSTGANKYNPFFRRHIIPIQRAAENKYIKERVSIIKKYSPQLPLSDLNLLSSATRGMRKEDIRSAIEIYIRHQKVPLPPKEHSVTCDPETGYWAENFIDPNELQKILKGNEFNVKILPGYFGFPNNKLKRIASTFLNIIISIVGRRGLFIAPYWTIYAIK